MGFAGRICCGVVDTHGPGNSLGIVVGIGTAPEVETDIAPGVEIGIAAAVGSGTVSVAEGIAPTHTVLSETPGKGLAMTPPAMDQHVSPRIYSRFGVD